MNPKVSVSSLLASVAFLALAAMPAQAIDWSGVQGKDVVLLYPGQASLEWVLTNGEHDGAAKFKQGKNCKECHIGEENKMGPLAASGKVNEPQPIAGKPGTIPAKVKVAHDADTLYVHLEFAEGTQPDAKQDAKYATKVSMMLSDGKVPEADRAGCWAACHDDSTDMASASGATRTKYLGKPRAKITRPGGGDEMKSADELAKLKADGYGLEYWEAELNPGSPAHAAAYTVFDKREEAKPAAVAAEASFANGTWSVTLSRKLHAGAPYKDIDPGKSFTVGFAIHAGHTARRFHYVSIDQSLVLDQGTADFVAAKK
ncbi:MAG: cytochrome c-552 precursor [Telmatospirillum sp.]|nr:cytochrome c-552 precursor [Telmatospirillum sp.]